MHAIQYNNDPLASFRFVVVSSGFWSFYQQTLDEQRSALEQPFYHLIAMSNIEARHITTASNI